MGVRRRATLRSEEPEVGWDTWEPDIDLGKPSQFSFAEENRRVTVYYFCFWGADFSS
jgi:hypothetical protein